MDKELMVKICEICQKEYSGVECPRCKSYAASGEYSESVAKKDDTGQRKAS